ncbi:MAG: 3-deoxy-D-manno-octulosonic acid transferase [Chitinophagales bacterium]
MAVLFYNFFLLLLKISIRISSLFNPKAGKWLRGRENIFQRLEKAISKNARLNDSFGQEKIIWMHCSSLGEFEQGRPVIEKLRTQYPGFKVLLTFFSPSGYEVKKDYAGADWVFYLPIDGPRNAKKFLEIVNPSLVIFVKYEFWYYYLKKIKYRNIPLLLISALFRKDMAFFKWYGGLQRKMLSRFDHLFVQNEESKQLMKKIGLENICTVSGDTRFDRVIEIAEKFEPISAIEQFTGNNKVIVAGSTWKEDEKVLQKAFTDINNPALKLIIAPHEINEKHLEEVKNFFPGAMFLSELKNTNYKSPETGVLIVDSIGLLSRIFKYGHITYVGGGLRTMGVHNVLEAAVYGRPVLFGPYYSKYQEAVGLVESGGGISFKDAAELKEKILFLLNDKQEYQKKCEASKQYVQNGKGSAEKIIRFIQEKRLLTS